MSYVTRQQIETFAYELRERLITIPKGITLTATVDFDEMHVPIEMRALPDIEYNTQLGIKFYLKDAQRIDNDL